MMPAYYSPVHERMKVAIERSYHDFLKCAERISPTSAPPLRELQLRSNAIEIAESLKCKLTHILSFTTPESRNEIKSEVMEALSLVYEENVGSPNELRYLKEELGKRTLPKFFATYFPLIAQ